MDKLASYKYCKIKQVLPEKNIWNNVWRIDAHVKKNAKNVSLVPILSFHPEMTGELMDPSQPLCVTQHSLSMPSLQYYSHIVRIY